MGTGEGQSACSADDGPEGKGPEDTAVLRRRCRERQSSVQSSHLPRTSPWRQAERDVAGLQQAPLGRQTNRQEYGSEIPLTATNAAVVNRACDGCIAWYRNGALQTHRRFGGTCQQTCISTSPSIAVVPWLTVDDNGSAAPDNAGPYTLHGNGMGLALSRRGA